MEIKSNEKLESEIISLIKNANSENGNMEKSMELFENNELTIESRKKILELVFKEKGAGFIRKLYNITKEKFENILDSDFKKKLFELSFNNTSNYPHRVFYTVAN